MKKLLNRISLIGAMLIMGPLCPARAEPLSFKLSDSFTLIMPLQIVKVVQLYSFSDKKGYIGGETNILEAKNFRLNIGAAPVLGTDANVPFASLETRLTKRFFDLSDNDVFFGVWVGKQSNQKSATYGLAASVQLW